MIAPKCGLTSDQVPFGWSFMGTCWSDEYGAQKQYRPCLRCPGEIIQVTLIYPYPDFPKEVWQSVTKLPLESAFQLSSDTGLWICGTRKGPRTKWIVVQDWSCRPLEKREVL